MAELKVFRQPIYIVRRMLKMVLPRRLQRGRPKTRFLDSGRADMRMVQEDDAEVREKGRRMICCGDYLKKK